MMKAFLVVHNLAAISSFDLTNLLNTRPEVKNWKIPFIGACVVVTDYWQTPTALRTIIQQQFGDGWFIIAPLESHNLDGWLPKDMWEFIQLPKSR